MLSLIVSLLVISPTSLRAADIPLNLQPPADPNRYFCTDRAGAERLNIQAKENADCHIQLKSTSSSDHSLDIIIGIGALLAGFLIGKSL